MWKSTNFGGFLCFRGPWGRSRPKGTPVFASPWGHGGRVSFMGVVLGTLVPLAVLFSRFFGVNCQFLLFSDAHRR